MFAHLHLHTEWSLLDGLSRVSDVVVRAKELGQEHLAITEHGNLHSVIEHSKACKEEGIHAVFGTEAYITEDITNKSKTSSTWHLVLLAKNNVGLKNLYQLSTISFLEGFYSKPRIDLKTLAAHSEGVIGSCACLAGEVPSAILKGDEEEAVRAIQRYKEVFDGNFYLELQPNSLEEQAVVNKALYRLAKDTHTDLIVTCDSHYVHKEDYETHSYLWRIGTKSTKSWAPDFYMWTEEELLAAGFPIKAIKKTSDIAKRCEATIDFTQKHFVKFDCPDGKDSAQYLSELVMEALLEKALKEKINIDKYSARVAYELSVIIPANFSDYFLVVWDYTKAVKDAGHIIGPGRGSAGGSLVTYLLKITEIDPIKYGIMFERGRMRSLNRVKSVNTSSRQHRAKLRRVSIA